MAAKRSNNRRRKSRGRFGFLYKFMSFLIILVVIVAGCVVFFRVNDVTVTGETRYPVEEIIEISGIEAGDNLFLVNKYQVSRQILRNLPYVDTVTIRRAFPDGVVISVTECNPTLVVEGGGGWWVADGKGKLLEKTGVSLVPGAATVTGLSALTPEAGTRLAVAPEESAKLQTLMEVVAAFEGEGMMDRVSAVDLTGSAAFTLEYDGRFTVKLPMTSTSFSRLARGLQNTIAALQSNEKGTIDMTREDKYYANVN